MSEFSLMPEYWIGPAGVLIPKTIRTVPALDGFNTVTYHEYGTSTTNMLVSSSLSEKAYKRTYAVKNADGYWYYKTNNTE